jgi:hypothetical protein
MPLTLTLSDAMVAQIKEERVMNSPLISAAIRAAVMSLIYKKLDDESDRLVYNNDYDWSEGMDI